MSILFATPCYGGQVCAQHMKSCLELREVLLKSGLDHDWLLMWNESLVQRARNNLCRTFLQESTYQKLMFLDADIEFRPEDVAALWNLQADVAVGLYPMKRLDCPLAAWRDGYLVDLKDCPDEPFAVDYAGTGFMMIDRSVLEKMRGAFPERVHTEANGDGTENNRSFAWFDPRVVGEVYLSEDYAFCRDWRALGGKIVADPSIQLIHHGAYAYGA